MRILFDFDGVLMNSCREAALTAFRAVSREDVARLEDLPNGCLKLFERNRHFFVPAGEALPLMRWCIEQLDGDHDAMLTVEKWTQVKNAETLTVAERGRLFFKARHEIVDRDKQSWLPLSEPYQPIWDTIKSIADEVVILTNKNRIAVVDLTDYWGLRVKPENIFAADGGVSKTDNLSKIIDRDPHGDWLFIDDQLTNLLKIHEFVGTPAWSAKIGRFELALAGWGYCDDNMRQETERAGFAVLSQPQFIERFLKR